MRGKKCFARLRRSDVPNQRMADEFHWYAGITKEFFFERKNAQRQSETPSHDACPPWPPRPKLWANVINVSNAQRLQFARQPQMKPWNVRQNGNRDRKSTRLNSSH